MAVGDGLAMIKFLLCTSYAGGLADWLSNKDRACLENKCTMPRLSSSSNSMKLFLLATCFVSTGWLISRQQLNLLSCNGPDWCSSGKATQ